MLLPLSKIKLSKVKSIPFWLRDRLRTYNIFWEEVLVPDIISPWHVNIMPATEHKLLFHTVPKVASSSLRFMMLALNGIDVSNMNLERMTRLSQHRFLRPFVSRLPRYRHYRHFAFVRNPWSRLLSCYRQQIENKKDNDTMQFFLNQYPNVNFRDMDFSDFVHFVCNKSERDSNHHFRSQHYFLAGGTMDFIGKYENFIADGHTLINRYGLPESCEHFFREHHNSSGNALAGSDYYNEETTAMVAKRYEKDIRIFGYRL